MKVALVAEWLDAWRGGAETSTQQFIHQLMDQGVELHLFTRSRLSPTADLRVHSINSAAMTRTRQSIAFIHRVDRHLAAENFDIVHAITPCRRANIYQPRGGTVAETIERNIATRSSRSARSMKRLTARLNLRQRYLLALERSMLTDPDGPIVVALSDYVVRQLQRHYDAPPARIRKIFNGVSPDLTPPDARGRDREEIRREYGLSDDALVTLTVAHNFRLKGVHRWMQALSLLRLRGVRDLKALVIGRGESPAWHRLARRLRLGDALIFVGQTDRVEKFYHAGDLLVHPTYYDPCSRVVLEAMSRGLPCITTKWDGAAELITDGRSGFVLDDPADTTTLARRVELLRDEDRRREMGQAARADADDVTMARHSKQMTALYAELRPAPASVEARAAMKASIDTA